MLSSGFAGANVTRTLFFGILASSILVSVTDSKHLFYINVFPQLWRYKQGWRLFIWQVSLHAALAHERDNGFRRLC